MMDNRFFKIAIALTIGTFSYASLAVAEDTFPNKSIRMIVPSGAGGGLDMTARLVADRMGKILNQSIIVENRPGASTLLGTRTAKAADPDGYTILAQAGSFLSTPLLQPDAGYDPFADFRGIGRMITTPMVISLGADHNEKDFKEFLEIVKANPNQLSYASGGEGSPSHLPMAELLYNNDAQMTHARYQGIAKALPDVAGGRVDAVADGFNSSRAYIEGGKLKPIATTGDRRIAALPNVSTLKEQGFDSTFFIWHGLLAPANTPDDVIARLSAALQEALKDQEINQRFDAEGSSTVNETPAEFDTHLKQEYDQLAGVLKESGLIK